MTDKVQKIREEVVRMHNLLPIMDGDNISVNYADRICTTLEMYIDSLQKEPVSEDYRKARRDAMFSINEQKGYAFKLQDMFDAGANWQKQQMMKNLPIWKKSKKLIEGALLDRGILYIPCYMIELSELKKLPKED